MIRHASIVGLYILLVANAQWASAQPLEWNKSTGTHGFSIGTNWTPNVVPGPANDVALGPNLASLDVQAVLGAASTAGSMSFTLGSVEFVGFGSAQLDARGAVLIDDAAAASPVAGARVRLNGSGGVVWDNVGDATVGESGFGTLTVDNSGDFTSASLYVGNAAGSQGEVNVEGSGSTLTAEAVGAAQGIFVGNAGQGTLNVTQGGLAQTTDAVGAADISLGFAATGEGTLNISGVGSRVIAEDFLVGERGLGHLVVSAGGVMDGSISTSPDVLVGHLTGSSGDAVVTGDNSRWLAHDVFMGNAGDGSLEILAGGNLAASGLMTLGDDVTIVGTDIFTSTGVVTVSGSGTTDDSLLSVGGILTVGNAGQGTLTVNGGGNVTVGDDLNVGNNAAATFDNVVTIDGTGSTITVTDRTTVGLAGRGTLQISGGGQLLSTDWIMLGSADGSQAVATVAGLGSQLVTANTLFVGDEGQGTLQVTGGGYVQAVGLAISDSDVDGDATDIVDRLTVSGSAAGTPSTVNVTGTAFFVGGSSNENGGVGELIIEAGGLVQANGLSIGSGNGGASDGTGTLTVTGPGSLLDADANGSEVVFVGDTGAGTLNVSLGGKVEAGAMRIGNEGGSETAVVNISGPGSRVELEAAMVVGNDRPASLSITDGAVLVSGKNDSSISTIGVGSNSDGAQVSVDGAGSLWDHRGSAASGTRLRIGQAGGANADGQRSKLSVTGGGRVLAHNLLVADGSINGVGELIIDGTDGVGTPSTVSASGFLVIGDDSLGLLTVSGGGRLETTAGSLDIGGTSNGQGVATVTGAGSTLHSATTLTVGRSSDGALVVADGASVSNVGHGIVGRDTGANSTVIIGSTTSDDSTWNNEASLYFGGDEFGSGAPVSVFINPGGTITVADTTKIWNGTVNLQGGTLATDALEIVQLGNFEFDSGTLRFTGEGGYALNAVNLGLIFGSDPRTLTPGQHLAIDNAAVITSPVRLLGGTLSLGTTSAADMSWVDFDAGTLNLTQTGFSVTAGGLLGSTLVIDEDEAVNTTGALSVQSDGLLSVARGSVSAAGAVNDGTIVIAEGTADFGTGLTNDGDLVLIDATTSGTITNNGDLTVVNTAAVSGLSLNSGGKLGLSLNGPNNFDALAIAGDATLGGSLIIDVSGFSLAAGDAFEILDVAGVLTGTFAGLADEALVGNFGGVDLFIDYEGGDGNDVVLFTPGGFSADFDGDGDVDGDDLAQWEGDFGGIGSDADGDGDSDGADWLAWQRQFGSGTSADQVVRAVPEPAAVVLLLLLVVTAAIGSARSRASAFAMGA
jgi:T5SS/PEP-CTERM-associated repeat protein